VVDAVNWYIGCTWEICRTSMTDVIAAAGSQFCQPEGAGGFHDDPLEWVTQGGWNCIMDYSIKLWWEGVDTIGDAVRTGDPRGVEAALTGYRDRVVNAGGICYIDPPSLEDMPVAARLLGAALAASAGELLILIGEQAWPRPEEYRAGLAELLRLRKQYPALCAGGSRRQIRTANESGCYALLRERPGETPVLAVFNLQADRQTVQLDLEDGPASGWMELNSGQGLAARPDAAVELEGYGYRFFAPVPG
jgi:hypothetical protein